MGEDEANPHGVGGDSGMRPGENDDDRDYDRDLGVIEAITMVTRSCPNGVVVSVANAALDAIKTGGAEEIPKHAYLVLTSMKGWRGDRATQVHRSLARYLDERASR